MGQISDKNVVSEVSEEENEYIYVKEHERQGIATTKDVTFAKIAEEKKEKKKESYLRPSQLRSPATFSAARAPPLGPALRPALPCPPAPPLRSCHSCSAGSAPLPLTEVQVLIGSRPLSSIHQ